MLALLALLPALAADWQPVLTPPPPLHLDVAVAAGPACIAGTAQGVAHRLDGTQWVALHGLRVEELHAADGALWLETATQDYRLDCSGQLTPVRRARSVRAPEPLPPVEVPDRLTLIGSTPDGESIACAPDGSCAVYLDWRTKLVHTWEPDGSRVYFHEPTGPGWEWFHGPQDAFTVLQTAPPLVVGRRGGVVTPPRSEAPRRALDPIVELPDVPTVYAATGEVLALQPLDGDRLVVVTDSRVLWGSGDAVHALPLDAPTQTWLSDAARAAPESASTVHSIALEDAVVVVWRTLGLHITAGQATLFDVAEPRAAPATSVQEFSGRGGLWEAVGLAPLGGDSWVALTTSGRWYRARGSRRTTDGTLAEPFQHTTGVFIGPDRSVHMVPIRGVPYCVTAKSVAPCGEPVALPHYRADPLADGLLIQESVLKLRTLSADGQAPLPDGPGGSIDMVSGTAAAPLLHVTMHGSRADEPPQLWQLAGDAWAPLSTLPCPAQALHADDEAVWVACRDGAVWRRPVR